MSFRLHQISSGAKVHKAMPASPVLSLLSSAWVPQYVIHASLTSWRLSTHHMSTLASLLSCPTKTFQFQSVALSPMGVATCRPSLSNFKNARVSYIAIMLRVVLQQPLPFTTSTSAPHFLFSKALDIAYDLAAGLEFIHGQSIIHNSFHPDNILFEKRQFVLSRGTVVPTSAKIIDFGNCKAIAAPAAFQTVPAPQNARQGLRFTFDVFQNSFASNMLFQHSNTTFNLRTSLKLNRVRHPADIAPPSLKQSVHSVYVPSMKRLTYTTLGSLSTI